VKGLEQSEHIELACEISFSERRACDREAQVINDTMRLVLAWLDARKTICVDFAIGPVALRSRPSRSIQGALARRAKTLEDGYRSGLLGADLSILGPVSHNAVSRRGAEVAIALTQVSPGPLRVVYGSTTRDVGSRRGRTSISLAREEAMLEDAAATAAPRCNVDVRSVVRAHAAPERAMPAIAGRHPANDRAPNWFRREGLTNT